MSKSCLGYTYIVCNVVYVYPANYDKFATQFDRIVAMDWLGMGGSSRFKTLPQAPLLWGSFQQEHAVDYFIDSLEEARQGLGIDSDFVLAGHSLGGFLSARYAMKYPASGQFCSFC